MTRRLKKLHKDMILSTRRLLGKATASGSRIHLTVDAWTGQNHNPYLGITGHWMDSEFVKHDLVLDLVRLHGHHSGESMARAVEAVLKTFGIEKSLGAVVTDNASNNTTMCAALQVGGIVSDGWQAKDFHVPCMAHVMNLSAQELIKTIAAEATEIPDHMVKETTFETFDAVANPGLVVKKVRRICAKLRASHILTELLEKHCIAVSCSYLRPQMDVATRYLSPLALPIFAATCWNLTDFAALDGIRRISCLNGFLIYSLVSSLCLQMFLSVRTMHLSVVFAFRMPSGLQSLSSVKSWKSS